MSKDRLRVWCNMRFPADATKLLEEVPCDLVYAKSRTASNLQDAGPDPDLLTAQVAFGQPSTEGILQAPLLKWVHLTGAGYERYTPEFLAEAKGRGILMTNSSSVYDEPCAQHALATMLALSRQLPQARANHVGAKAWPIAPLRMNSYLLRGQTTVMLGFGAIGRRLAQMLAPFEMNLIAVRRTTRGDEPVQIMKDADAALAMADHVVNLLPGGPETKGFMSAARFGKMKAGAIFYNIGRGSTVDQEALIAALNNGGLRAAFLDVTDPEPLPPEHPLWAAANCYITPHTAGGHVDEFLRLVRHFATNLERYSLGLELLDRIA